MRILAHSAALLALSGCMSNSVTPDSARVKNSKSTAAQTPDVRSEVQPDEKNRSGETPKETANAEAPATPKVATEAPSLEATVPAPSSGSADCHGIKDGMQIPYFLSEQPVLFLQFVKACTTTNGMPGYGTQSSWTALGVPCSGGLGRIDKRGHETNSPSVVRFQLALNCPMAPARTQDAERAAQKSLNLPGDARLIAFYPLTVEYWEFENSADTGLGSNPTLTSAPGLSNWQKFVNHKSTNFPVKLYGRENSWSQSKFVYEVSANILPENRSQFRIQVQKMRQLSEEEAKTVLDRCKSNESPAGCEEIFNSR